MPESTYWIIVSDEGPSTHPKRHSTFESAKTESIRLAKLRPDLKFGVFESVGVASATPAKKTVTKWMRILKRADGAIIPGADFFDTKEESETGRSAYPGLYHGKSVPVLVEIDVDQSVTFDIPTAVEKGKLEFRFYGLSPMWGISKGDRFYPFGGTPETKEIAKFQIDKDLSHFFSLPLSECPTAF